MTRDAALIPGLMYSLAAPKAKLSSHDPNARSVDGRRIDRCRVRGALGSPEHGGHHMTVARLTRSNSRKSVR